MDHSCHQLSRFLFSFSFSSCSLNRALEEVLLHDSLIHEMLLFLYWKDPKILHFIWHKISLLSPKMLGVTRETLRGENIHESPFSFTSCTTLLSLATLTVLLLKNRVQIATLRNQTYVSTRVRISVSTNSHSSSLLASKQTTFSGRFLRSKENHAAPCNTI